MPVQKVPGGYRWGDEGKVFPTKEKAAEQGRAIEASKAARKKKPGRKSSRKRK